MSKPAIKMTPAQLRKELGDVLLRLETICAKCKGGDGMTWGIAFVLEDAIDSVKAANNNAGKLLVAQLTDADREQAKQAEARS